MLEMLIAIVAHPAVSNIGILIAVVVFFVDRWKERQLRQNELYNATDERYLAFLKLSLENIDLDIFDIGDSEIAEEARKHNIPLKTLKKELILFSILIKTCERAFLMFHENKDSDYYHQQWKGWEDYIKDYCSRGNFQRAWCIIGGQFDVEFRKKISGWMPSQENDCGGTPVDPVTLSQ